MPIILAPIRGITDWIYRDSFTSCFGGFDSAVAPFVASMKNGKLKAAQLRDVLPENNQKLSVVPQILSKDADDFIQTAERIFSYGYQEINWNLGCPTPMVAHKKRGSGLLPYPEKVASILHKVTDRFPCAISVKMRLGRHRPEEILQLLPLMNDLPLKRIIIHPRLGVQMYKGSVDLDSFARCLPHCKHPVVYNGDIVSPESLARLQKKFPMISDWMVGRGCLWNPYLALQLQGIAFSPSKKSFLTFHNQLFERYSELLYGPSHLLGKMKGIWYYLSKIFLQDHIALKRITKSQTIEKYKDAISKNFEQEKLVFLEHTA